jgi:hypothetical protein
MQAEIGIHDITEPKKMEQKHHKMLSNTKIKRAISYRNILFNHIA